MLPRKTALFILCCVLSIHIVPAQEIPPLILENEGKVQVKTRKKTDPQEKKEDPTKPKPNPADVIVAFADGRVLTRAELDLRVTNEFERVKEEVQSRIGGVIATTGGSGATSEELKEKQEVLAEQDEQIDMAMRKEESNAVQLWVEHATLAEEARRQGMVITEGEFKTRLEQAQAVNRLAEVQVENALNKMKLSRADYERGFYDALMIEKMLGRFIELNYTDADFRKAYDQAPQLYYTPEKFQIAHFTIALDGTESRTQINNLTRLANEVRDELRKGADPAVLFDKPEYNRIEQGIFGSVPGYYSFQEGALPNVVEYYARQMKVGETSNVLTAQRQEGKQIIPISLHVVKILKSSPEEGKDFESALPAIHRAMLGIARGQVLAMIRAAKTHDVITNLTGIPSSKLPDQGELLRAQKEAQPINLKFDRSKPPVDEREIAAQQDEEEPHRVAHPALEDVPPPIKRKKHVLTAEIDPALIPTPLPAVTPQAR
ncbi:hypothetical protein IT570_08460 [Candidatus Sumerlaeota bacterium]|nr:hypothetical protein [Candidatus Sumerlaeota bacterium]